MTMNKKIYLVWIRYPGDTEDRIRGMALNWEKAEKMALHLEWISETKIEVGVKSYVHGESSIKDDGSEDRWGKESFEVEYC